MKKIIVLICVGAGAWWFFIGGRKLSEEQVTDFYRNLEIATLERKPENLCALLAEDFEATGVLAGEDRKRAEVNNKLQTCEAYHQLYKTWEELGEKMGGLLQLDSNYVIHSITLSPDRQMATVDISSSLDVAGSIMNIRSRSTDTLIRRNGKVMMLRSEGAGTLAGGT